MLTDVVMPRLGGKAFVDELARLHPETNVLFMSGYNDEAVAQRGTLGPGVSAGVLAGAGPPGSQRSRAGAWAVARPVW